jgi:hypothetical protein
MATSFGMVRRARVAPTADHPEESRRVQTTGQ